MNIIDILKGIENLAVQLLLMLIYIPKTIFKIIKDPNWVNSYVTEELEKQERFENFVSPVLLYLISSVVLFVIISMIGIEGMIGIIEEKENLEFIEQFSQNLQGLNGITAGLGFLSIPLFCSLFTEIFRSAKFTRKSITRILYIQCYYFSPLILAIFCTLILGSLKDKYSIRTEVMESDATEIIIWFSIVLFTIIWFVVVEIKFIAKELGSGIWKAVRIFGLGGILIGLGLSVFGYVTENTPINNNPIGEPEKIIVKLPKTGEFRIFFPRDYQGEYELFFGKPSIFNISPDSLDFIYPMNGIIGYDRKVIGSFPKKNEVLPSSLLGLIIGTTSVSVDSNQQKDVSKWNFNGERNDLFVVKAVTINKGKDLKFNLIDSLGNQIQSRNTRNNGWDLFEIYEDGEFTIEVHSNNDSSDTSYELALLQYQGIRDNIIRLSSKYEALSVRDSIEANLLSNYIRDKILFQANGYLSLSIRQKVRSYSSYWDSREYTKDNTHQGWTFKGQKDESVYIKLDPLGIDDASFFLVDDTGNSILKMSALPKFLGILFSILFLLPFALGVRAYVLNLKKEAVLNANQHLIWKKMILSFLKWVLIFFILYWVVGISFSYFFIQKMESLI